MNPISNQFSHDYKKYVIQDPNVQIVHRNLPPPKPFKLEPPEKSQKTKKDSDKKKQKEKDNLQ